MISSVFKKIGKGKVLAVLEALKTPVLESSLLQDIKDAKSQNLLDLIAKIKVDAFSIAPSMINDALHGHLANKPISLNCVELKIIVGARSHIDYALKCTIDDLNSLTEKDIHAACTVAEQITEIFISKSGVLRELSLMDMIANGTSRKFIGFLHNHHEAMKTLKGMNKIHAVVDLINELRRIQGRLVDPNVIACFCRIMNEEILSLDILGPTLRFGITDSLCHFYLAKIDESVIVIGMDAEYGAPNLCFNSDANTFLFLGENIDNNSNKSVIKRMHEMKCQELNNLFSYGILSVVVYDASQLKGSIKSLNYNNTDDVIKLLQNDELEVIDTIIDYSFSTLENLENITLRAFAKEYQNDLRFHA